MGNTPEYLKQPEHIERANQFVNQVENVIAPNYEGIYIEASIFQQENMDVYDFVLREGLQDKVPADTEARVLDWLKVWSDLSEREAVDQVDVSVYIWRSLSGVDPSRLGLTIKNTRKTIRKAKKEVENQANKSGGEKDRAYGQIIEEEYPEFNIHSISSFNAFVFKPR